MRRWPPPIVLWEEGHLPPSATIRFHTRSGLLTADRRGDWIELDFPVEPAEPAQPPDALVEALGAPVRSAGRNRFDWLIELDSEAAVRGLVPDITRLATVPTRGVIVTSRAESPGFDFVSRFFAPRLGVPEDPVCGSAHCCLAPFWSQRLGRTELVGYQASPRGGVVRVRHQGAACRARRSGSDGAAGGAGDRLGFVSRQDAVAIEEPGRMLGPRLLAFPGLDPAPPCYEDGGERVEGDGRRRRAARRRELDHVARG